jgi:pSer/pThr/pTyr-binding forkhead associated (FHA) protein
VPGAPTAQISIEIDGKIIQECRLDKPALTVGRQDGRDIQIKHQSVSRTHAKIIVENGSWVVEDAGSVNGIVFNGHRVQRATVKNGDRVFIAPNIALIFKIA